MTKNYVKTYKGHDVPDGGNYYCGLHDFYAEAFYKVRDGGISFFNIAVGACWVSTDSMPDHAIELPLATEQDLPNWDEAPSDTCVWIVDNRSCPIKSGWYKEVGADETTWFNLRTSHTYNNMKELITVHKRPIAPIAKEWLPTVGEECDVNDCFGWGRSFIIGRNRYNKYIYQKGTQEKMKVAKSMDHMRPLKTAEELKREAFIEWAKRGLSYRLEEQAFAYRIIEEIANNLESMPK